MNYLLDKKIKRKKIGRWTIFVVLLFFLFYFRADILKGLTSVSHFVFRPFFVLGNNLENGFGNLGIYFSSKKNLSLENEVLKLQLKENKSEMTNYNSVLDENSQMKGIMERNNFRNDFILAAILEKPNRSLYDTLIIDIGAEAGIIVGQRVFALGNIPIGYIGETYAHSSKVVLFSSPGERTDIVISGKDIFIQIVGRGSGNFEMILPRDLIIESGTEITLPGITPFVLAKVQKMISDPHDSYQKVLLASPVNIFELKFVQVEK